MKIKMDKKYKSLFVKLMITVFITFILFLVFVYIRIRISLPIRKGELRFKGLKDKVMVYFNEYGIPFIEAKYIEDLFFLQGYLHAQDRMFQMDIMRRVGEGRLSEIFGEKTFKIDSFYRLLGIKRIAEKQVKKLFGIERKILESYTKGVNAYIRKNKGRLPLEFFILNYSPEEWKIEHTIIIGRLISWDLNLSYRGDLLLNSVFKKLGDTLGKNFVPFYPKYAPYQMDDISIELIKNTPEGLEEFNFGLKASNSFAISSPPIIANDPHLKLNIPSFWYLNYLKCDSFEAVGFSVPGIPLVIIGTNWKIGVGVTSLSLDDGDFIIIKEIDKIGTIEERIKIKNRGYKRIKILLWKDIPVIKTSPFIGYFWRSYLVSHEIYSLYNLFRSSNIYQADSSLMFFRTPALNFVIVDKNGDILYKACGWIEKRKTPSFLFREDLPEEFVEDTLLPKKKIFNKGYLVSCNNPPSKDYPYYISVYFAPSGRAKRADELIYQNIDNMSDEKMKSIVLDVRDKYAETVLNYLLNILKTAPMDKKEKDIYLKLKGFDFLMKKEKEEPLLFYRFLIKVLENTFKELLGDTLYDKFIDLYYFPFNVLENWLHSDMVSRSDIVQAFREIVKDYKKESYGEYHKSKFHHPFSNSKIIGRMFRLKSIPLDGGITTVNKMEFSITNPFDVIEGPSMRMIVNLRDNKFYYILPPGESGVVFDKNYSDMIELWAEGEFLELFPFNAVNKLFIYPISQ